MKWTSLGKSTRGYLKPVFLIRSLSSFPIVVLLENGHHHMASPVIYVSLMLSSDTFHSFFFLECLLVVIWGSFRLALFQPILTWCWYSRWYWCSLHLWFESWILGMLDCKKLSGHQHGGTILIKIHFSRADWLKGLGLQNMTTRCENYTCGS